MTHKQAILFGTETESDYTPNGERNPVKVEQNISKGALNDVLQQTVGSFSFPNGCL